MTTTRTILDEIYDAWRDHDLERLASYLPDEFSHVIHIPQDVHPLGGMCHGKKAVLERLSLIFTQFDSLRLDPSEVVIAPIGPPWKFKSIADTRKPAGRLSRSKPISGRSKLAGP